MAFATLRQRVGCYNLFQGQNRTVGIYNHFPLIEIKIIEHYETMSLCLLARPIVRLSAEEQCENPQREIQVLWLEGYMAPKEVLKMPFWL